MGPLKNFLEEQSLSGGVGCCSQKRELRQPLCCHGNVTGEPMGPGPLQESWGEGRVTNGGNCQIQPNSGHTAIGFLPGLHKPRGLQRGAYSMASEGGAYWHMILQIIYEPFTSCFYLPL